MDFIRKMLTYDPNLRISVQQALNDPWILKYTSSVAPNKDVMLKSLDELKLFRTQSAIQKAVLTYLARRSISKAEEKDLRQAFLMLDKNGDGQISAQELEEAYMLAYKQDAEEAKKNVSDLMGNVDLNKNGLLDYNGKVKGPHS